MTEPRLTMWDSFLAAYDLDQFSAVPRALRLRTIHLLAVSLGVVAIAAAIAWPRAWQLVALAALAATSLLFALAAGREWFLRYRLGHRLLSSELVGARGCWKYRTVVS